LVRRGAQGRVRGVRGDRSGQGLPTIRQEFGQAVMRVSSDARQHVPQRSGQKCCLEPKSSVRGTQCLSIGSGVRGTKYLSIERVRGTQGHSFSTPFCPSDLVRGTQYLSIDKGGKGDIPFPRRSAQVKRSGLEAFDLAGLMDAGVDAVRRPGAGVRDGQMRQGDGV